MHRAHLDEQAHLQMASAVWGWRLELAIGLLVFAVVRFGSIFGPGGPILVGGLVAIALWQLPPLRSRLSAAIRHSREARRVTSAFRSCHIVGRDGRVPLILRTSDVEVGTIHLLRLPPGVPFEILEPLMSHVASALAARETRLRRIARNAALVEMIVVRRDVLSDGVITSPVLRATQTSLWVPMPIGIGEDGPPCGIELPEHNLLIGGEPGSGKSVVLSSIVAVSALDPTVTLTLLDGKLVELAPWKGVAETFAGSDLTAAVEALRELQHLMDCRYDVLLAEGRRKIHEHDSHGLHVLVIDELAFYLRGGPRAQREEFSESLRDIVSRGRAAGVIVVAATQKPSHDVVPTWIRDLFSYRIAMRCTSPEASDTILGQGWATRGYNASTIDPGHRGVGYLLAEGGVPIRFKACYLSDEDIAALALRAQILRSGR